MSENTIFIKKYALDDARFGVNRKEIWRYSGYMGFTDAVDEEVEKQLDKVIQELQGKLAYKVCYRRMDITWEGEMPVLPFESESKNLAKCLKGSSEIIMFAATVGLEIDRHIAKYQRMSPVKALLAQAYGAERVECLCDVFCDEIKELVAKEGKTCTNRFSPGYGDMPLAKQIDFFKLLDCNRQIGISLNESLLMTPSKSVTAIFGIGECVSGGISKCENCGKTNCEFREK